MGWQDAPAVENKSKWQSAPIVDKQPPKYSPAWVREQRENVGLAARAGIKTGLAALVGLPVDTMQNIWNLSGVLGGSVAALAGRPELQPNITTDLPGSSEAIMRDNTLGLKPPEFDPSTRSARLANTAGMIVGGSLAPGATIKNTLAAAAGGAVAGEAIGPNWAALGSLAPVGARAAITKPRQVLAERTRTNLAPFSAAGAKPTVGLVTDAAFLDGLESIISKFPGGTGIMNRVHEQMQADIGRRTKTGVSAEDAGRAIEQGIAGGGGFLERTKETWNRLDQMLAEKLAASPAGTKLVPQNTLKALDDLTIPMAGAEASTGGLTNKTLKQMRADLGTDLSNNPGGLPYEAIRKIRTKVGGMLDNALISDVPTGELKKVYGALTSDMESAAKAAGAGNDFARQNKYYAARSARIENVLTRVLGKGRQPEDIFKAFYPTDPNQANKVRAVMRSLEPAERQVVTQAVVDRMGRITPEGAFGDTFSTENFLNRWGKLSAGAKAQLFPDAVTSKNMDIVAAAANSIREGSGVLGGTSSAAGSFAATKIYLAPLLPVGALISLGTVSMTPVLTAAGAVGSANLGARLLTNQKFINWLAKAPPDVKAVPAHISRLVAIYNSTDDEELKKELGQYVQAIGENQ